MRVVSLLAVLTLAVASSPPAQAAPLDTACPYRFGFADLKAQLSGRMGDPTSCEYPDPRGTGDTEQNTTNGLAFWRKSTNTPTFTNGFDHWALTTGGLVYWTGDSIDPPSITAAPPAGLTPTEAATTDRLTRQARLSAAAGTVYQWAIQPEADLVARRKAALQDFTQGYLTASQAAEKFDWFAFERSGYPSPDDLFGQQNLATFPDMLAVLVTLGTYLSLQIEADRGYRDYMREYQQAGNRISASAQLAWDRAQNAAANAAATWNALHGQWRGTVCVEYGVGNFEPASVGC